jgi:sugar lactone lactonase YvrE
MRCVGVHRRPDHRTAALAVAGWLAWGAASAASTELRFELPREAVTSAGVYDTRGRLLRTLWSGERLAAGVHRRRVEIDSPAGTQHAVTLIHHRVQAHWEGVIGNSSAVFGGPQVHRAMFAPSGLALVGDRLFYVAGYNEGGHAVHAFDLRQPQRALRPIDDADPFVGHSMIASDGRSLFVANAGGLARHSFVLAYDPTTGQRRVWPEGRTLCLNWRVPAVQCYEGHTYSGVIDVREDARDLPSGLAVQARGPLLAVARPARGVVTFYDKHSGRPLRELRAALPAGRTQQIAFAPNGDLWVLERDRALRYAEGAGEPAAMIAGLEAPLAIAVHPSDDDAVWIAEGGGSQRLRRFDRSGRAGAAFGRAGGCRDGEPAVRERALCFMHSFEREQTALAVQADGTLWVVDTGHNRMLHLDPAAGTRQRVAYLPTFYASTVDANDATRVFANFLEFEVDADKPLSPGGWRLVRNWLPGMPSELRGAESANRAFAGFRSVTTPPGGPTLALVGGGGAAEAIVILPAQGPLRIVRRLAAPLPGATRKVLYENGDLGWSVVGAGTQTVLRQRLLGFDAQGLPRWSPEPERIASVPLAEGSPHERRAFSGLAGPRHPMTASDQVVFFDPSVTGNEGFHLGAARQGASQWLWMASPSAPLDGRGSFQTREADRRLRSADRGIQYGGNVAMAVERDIVYGFHGEFYTDQANGKVGQANQFMHFHDSGLFVQQFGLPTTRTKMPAEPGAAGNAFSPTLVRQGDRLYLHHNDESVHGGIHRWRIDGWRELGELRGSGAAGSVIELR